MNYTKEQINNDLFNLTPEQFLIKYINRSDNWYFENILLKPLQEHSRLTDEYKLIVSQGLKISMNSITMVGSGKIGYSLSPKKYLLPFNDDDRIRDKSDLDIVLVARDLFDKFWGVLRKNYRSSYKSTYDYIIREIYRGYINERNILEIDEARSKWEKIIAPVRKRLSEELYIRHEITFRIYRSWEDFDDYNLQNIYEIKRSLKNV